MKVRYTARALGQLDAIYSHIESHDPGAARRVVARIQKSIARIGRFPYSCRETDRPGIRVLAVTRHPYLVFYSVDEAAEEVHILRVRHSARDPKRHLE